MPPDHEITKVLAGDKLLPPEEAVHELNGLSIRHMKTPVQLRRRRGLAGVDRSPHLGIRSACAWIDWPLIGGMRGLEREPDVLPRAAAGIDPAANPKLLKSCLVEGVSLALFVRPKMAAAIMAFLPLKTQPAQILQHRFGKSHLGSNRVDIIAAQNQNPLSLHGPLLGRPESAGVTDVQVARRGGRQSATILNAAHVPGGEESPDQPDSA